MSSGDPRRASSAKDRRRKGSDRREAEDTADVKEDAVGLEPPFLPDAPETPVLEEQEKIISSCEETIKNLKERLLRTTAEFDNYRKRQARDFSRLCNQGKKELIEDLLAVLDNIDRAEALNNGNHPAEEISTGLFQTLEMLKTVLDREGLSEIKTDEMDQFNPNIHEAMMAEDREDIESDSVLQVLQKGYMLGNELLRPVRVKVGRAIQPDGEEQ